MATHRQRITSGSPYEERYGFSRAIRDGQRVWVAGTAPILDDGSCDPDPGQQARRCFDLIVGALAEAGAGAEDVVRTRMYLTRAELADVVGRVHGEYFGVARPVATMVVVQALIDPAWYVEVEAEALVH